MEYTQLNRFRISIRETMIKHYAKFNWQQNSIILILSGFHLSSSTTDLQQQRMLTIFSRYNSCWIEGFEMTEEIKVKRRISEHESRPHIAEIETEDIEESLIQIEYPKSIEFRPNNAEWDGDDDWSDSSSDGDNQSDNNQHLEISDKSLGESSRGHDATSQSEQGLMLMKYSDSSLVSFHDVLDSSSANIGSRPENSSRSPKEKKSKPEKVICYNLFIQMSYCKYSLRHWFILINQ